MLDTLKERAARSELMDDLNVDGDELAGAYRRLRTLNRLFAAAGATRYGVERLWDDAGRPSQLTVLDVGAGSGDVNRALLRWADKRGIDLHVRLADVREEACREARKLFHDEERVEVVQGDFFTFPERQADIVTATQFVHHFDPDDIPRVIGRLLDLSRFGVVVNDIRRHVVPWAAVWLTTRLISRNRCLRHDGPLSVARGFRASDWAALAADPKLGELYCRRRFPYRYVVVIRRRDGLHGGGDPS